MWTWKGQQEAKEAYLCTRACTQSRHDQILVWYLQFSTRYGLISHEIQVCLISPLDPLIDWAWQTPKALSQFLSTVLMRNKSAFFQVASNCSQTQHCNVLFCLSENIYFTILCSAVLKWFMYSVSLAVLAFCSSSAQLTNSIAIYDLVTIHRHWSINAYNVTKKLCATLDLVLHLSLNEVHEVFLSVAILTDLSNLFSLSKTICCLLQSQCSGNLKHWIRQADYPPRPTVFHQLAIPVQALRSTESDLVASYESA